MIKVIVAIPKRADLSDERFHAYWIEPHGRLALNIRVMRRYVQAHRIRHPGLDAGPYEGFAEVWLDDLATALGLGHNPDYREHLVPDEPNFCDVAGLRFLISEEDVVIAGPPFARDANVFKVLQLVRPAAGLDDIGFRAAFGGPADAAAAAALGLLRYVRCRACAGTVEPGRGFAAARELWWPDAATFDAARASAPDAWRTFAEDSIIDRSGSLIDAVEELRLLW